MTVLRNLPHINQSSVADNPLAAILYLIAYPFALIFKKLGIKPNLVSLISFVLTLCAVASSCIENIYLYSLFWVFSFLFDFADGTLARMTNNIGKTALRVDHTFDLFKFSTLFFGFGIHFNSLTIWTLSFFSLAGYLLYTIFNHEVRFYSKLNLISDISPSNSNNVPPHFSGVSSSINNVKNLVNSNSLLRKLTLIILKSFTTLDAHIVIVFLLIPINYTFALFLLSYFLILTSYCIIQRLFVLSRTPKYK